MQVNTILIQGLTSARSGLYCDVGMRRNKYGHHYGQQPYRKWGFGRGRLGES
jgi:hypothetical protein